MGRVWAACMVIVVTLGSTTAEAIEPFWRTRLFQPKTPPTTPAPTPGGTVVSVYRTKAAPSSASAPVTPSAGGFASESIQRVEFRAPAPAPRPIIRAQLQSAEPPPVPVPAVPGSSSPPVAAPPVPGSGPPAGAPAPISGSPPPSAFQDLSLRNTEFSTYQTADGYLPPGEESERQAQMPTEPPLLAEQIPMPREQTPLPREQTPGQPLMPGSVLGPVQDPFAFSPEEADNWSTATPTRPYFYGQAEYLLWWIQGDSIPPLVTAGTLAQPVGFEAALSQPGTQVLFGGSELHGNDVFSGGRVTLGLWLDEQQQLGVETSWFALGQQSDNFHTSSSENLIFGESFFIRNPVVGAAKQPGETSALVSVPFRGAGTFDLRGSIAIDAPSQLWGGEVNLRRNLLTASDYRLDLISGVRYLDLEEGLHMSADVVFLKTAEPTLFGTAGNVVRYQDRFDTHNQFYGGQVGAAGQYRYGAWTLDGSFKLGLGITHQQLSIAGNTEAIMPNGSRAGVDFATYANKSNIGTYERNTFTVVPEVGIKLGYCFSDCFRIWAGYDFLYWSSVLRPGREVDRNINLNDTSCCIKTVPEPAGGNIGPRFNDNGFWAQGINVGVELRY